MTSATDRICGLLAERGIDYKLRRSSATSARETVFWEYEKDGDWATAEYAVTVPLDGYGTLEASRLTPEQAIAATLGNTTCEYVIEDNMNESEGMGDVWFRCTNCDTCYDYQADDWLMKMPHCPKCGATVKGVR